MLHMTIYIITWCLLDSMVSTIATTGQSKTLCPHNCTCVPKGKCEFGLTVDCSNQGMGTIPRVPADVRCLILSGNNISIINAKSLISYAKLNILDLSVNNVEHIEKEAFQILKHLRILRLDSNNMTLNNWSLPPHVFDGLESLQILHIHNNAWNSTQSYRDDLFSSLTSMKEIKLDGYPDGLMFGSKFSKLIHLETLHIFGGFNKINNNTFQNLKNCNLSTLNIASGKLCDIEPLALSHLSKLHTLSLSDNPGLNIKNASHGWYGLQFTKIEQLYLNRIGPNGYFGTIKRIDESFYFNLNLTKLKVLTLEGNWLIYIEPKMSHYLPQLEYLSVANNRLIDLSTFVEDMMYLQYLKALSIAYQQMIQPPNKREMDKLIGQGDRHQELLLQEKKEMSWEAQSPNMYQKVKRSAQNSEENYIIFPPNLEKLLAAASLYKYLGFLGPSILFGVNKIRYIDYSNNNIKRFRGPFIVTHPNRDIPLTVKLRENGMEYISYRSFDESVKNGLQIISLDLYDNNLGDQFANKSIGEDGISVRDLKLLNIGKNNIRHLPFNATGNLPNIETLNLSSNSLKSVNVRFSNNPRLQVLDLSFNLLQYLDKNERQTFDSFKDRRRSLGPLQIFLTGNPLICSCESLSFLNWMKMTNVRFISFDSYECAYNGIITPLQTYYDMYETTLKKQCASKAYIVASAGAFGLLIFLIVIAILVYHNRWDVKFFCLHTIIKRKEHQAKSKGEKYQYDAFVAYHEEDHNWVVQKLLHKLENQPQGRERKLHLCVHYRDFLPGTSIEENIVDAISNSRKVILVLTNNFVTSSWCDFELQMARMKSFDEGRDQIIVIMKEEVEAHKMTRTLRALIRRITYIQWPKQESNEATFWENLQKSILSSRFCPIQCECGRYI